MEYLLVLALCSMRWFCIARVNPLGTPWWLRLLALLSVALPMALIGVVLKLWSDPNVRSDDLVFFCFFLAGAGWMIASDWIWEMLGLSLRDDVLERHNPATPLVIAGAYLGTALCFAGANIGNGPGWPAVLLCASLSTLALFALWWGLNACTRMGFWVTVDGHLAIGLRISVLLVVWGIILGRSVAGPWVSTRHTLVSFAELASPSIVLLLVEIRIHRRFKQCPRDPSVLRWGWLPALAYAGFAILFLVLTLPW